MIKLKNESKSVVVIFDLDGTITQYDTYLRYLIGYLIRHPQRLLAAVTHLPLVIVRFYLGYVNNTYMKKQFLNTILAGSSRKDIDTWNQEFIDKLMKVGVRKAALACIDYHRMRGNRLILATASFDFYVRPLAKKLGFENVVCTRSKWTGDGLLLGDLKGSNCYGETKLEILRRDYNGILDASYVIAYSDHHSDIPLLSYADEAVAVNPTFRLAKLVDKHGFRSETWE